MGLFKIECFIEDSGLGRVKRALASSGAKDVTDKPVANAHFEGKKVKVSSDGSHVSDLVHKEIIKAKKDVVNIAELKKFVAKAGFSETSYSYYARQLVDKKLLKPTDERGTYKVMRSA